MKKLLTSVLSVLSLVVAAQTTADFENFNIGLDSALNDSGMNNGFSAGNIFMPNSYNAAWNAWSGWAISSMRDTTTAGYLNDLSAITGSGHNSPTYAVTYASPESKIMIEGAAAGGMVNGMYVTNATYTYLSMRDGDAFAKKFGGLSGDDPDYLLLTIQKYKDGVLGPEKVEFFLADYRFTDNSQDYIVDDWQYVDLTSLANVDSLVFTLTSTDVGAFGMNTPAYFCIDDLTTADYTVTTQTVSNSGFRAFPNPATDVIQIENFEPNTLYMIVDYQGRVMEQGELNTTQVPIYHLPKGIYRLILITDDSRVGTSFVKQ